MAQMQRPILRLTRIAEIFYTVPKISPAMFPRSQPYPVADLVDAVETSPVHHGTAQMECLQKKPPLIQHIQLLKTSPRLAVKVMNEKQKLQKQE